MQAKQIYKDFNQKFVLYSHVRKIKLIARLKSKLVLRKLIVNYCVQVCYQDEIYVSRQRFLGGLGITSRAARCHS